MVKLQANLFSPYHDTKNSNLVSSRSCHLHAWHFIRSYMDEIRPGNQ